MDALLARYVETLIVPNFIQGFNAVFVEVYKDGIFV
jgi:hypothetical protein